MIYEQSIRCFRRDLYYLTGMLTTVVMIILPAAITERLGGRNAGVIFGISYLLLAVFLFMPFRSESIRRLFVYEVDARFYERSVTITGSGIKRELEYSEIRSVELEPYRTELFYVHDNSAREHCYGYALKIKTSGRSLVLYSVMEQRKPNFFKMKGMSLGEDKVLAVNLPGTVLPLKEDIKELDIKILFDALKTNGQSVARSYERK